MKTFQNVDERQQYHNDIMNWFKSSGRLSESDLNSLNRKLDRLESASWREGYHEAEQDGQEY